jgi:D-glycero-alpha-D-manno-heptose-7-phosphate kinase
MIVRARAPLRLGLAGGGTDVSPYCDLHGGYVLNATIDRYAYATIRLHDGNNVRFAATDLQVDECLTIEDRVQVDGRLKLHKAVYNYMIQTYNGGMNLPLDLVTFCDAPAGSGLGSSSTLVVATIKAFTELLNIPMDDYAIAHLAFHLERIECGLQGGRQDQYSATFGGFNFMEFYEGNRAIINPLRIKNYIICELEASLVLYYTGVSRESARIIEAQVENMRDGSHQALDAMHGLKREALAMKEALLKGDFEHLVESMKMGWENKKLSAASVTNPHIEDIFNAALSAGARAGKISGAGGGGFMIFFVPPDRRMDVVRSLNRYDGQVSNCHFTKNGAQAWRL